MQKFLRAIVVLGVGTLVGAGVGVAPLLADSNETAIGSPNATAQSSLSLGSHHSCALTSAGAVKCWGLNSGGQLGNGTNVNSSAAVDVFGLGAGVIAISAGTFYTCALTSAGAVKCWGANNRGQLGDGTTTAKNVPTDVSGLGSGVVAISAGGHHSCALTSAGAVKCWGYNTYGQLGDGTSTGKSVAVNVSGLGSGVVAIHSGGNHSCSLMSNNAVKCWGINTYGQLGVSGITSSNTPVDVGASAPTTTTTTATNPPSTTASSSTTVSTNTLVAGSSEVGPTTAVARNLPTTGLVISEVIAILLGLILCQFGVLLLLVKHRRRTV